MPNVECRRRSWRRWIGLAAVALLSLAAPLAAQEDPFGAPGAAPAAAPPVAPGAPTDATAAPGAAADGKTRPAEPKEVPLAVQLLRATNPQTPAELLSAAETALALGEPEETKTYLAQFVAAKPADDVLAGLARQYADLLFRLEHEKPLQPEGKQAADMIRQAAQRLNQNEARLAGLVAQLSAADLPARQAALAELATTGRAMLTPLLRALADPNRAKEQPYIQAALVRLAGETEPPLLAALDASSELLRANVAEVLGQMRSRRAIALLTRPAVDPAAPPAVREAAARAIATIVGAAPTLPEAQQYLKREAARLLRGELPYVADADGRVELWSWDAGNQTVASRKLPKADAALLLATRMARDLFALSPGEGTAQRLALLLNLELAQTLTGLDRPLPAESEALAAARAAGPQVVSQVLTDALHHGRVPAALAAIAALEQLGDPQVLRTASSQASPLAEAMHFSDRRVRLAAALAAVRLAPGAPFPGAGRVAPALGWFVRTAGRSSVLVAHPRGEDAQTLVGFMNALGYQGEAAYTGRQLAERALIDPDYDFLLLSDAIDGPPVAELVQWLRRDYRTARVPIGVMARGENVAALRDALADDRYTLVFPRLHSTDVAARQIEGLKAIAGRNLVSMEERIAHARLALAALAELAQDNETLVQYDLLQQEEAVIVALYHPALSAAGAQVLGKFGTPRAQQALLEFARQSNRPQADREAAEKALEEAVRRRGMLFSRKE